MKNNIIEKAAKQLNLPYNYVWEVYSAYWKFVKDYLSSLPIKEDLSREEFDKLKTSVNVPSLGKFFVEWEHLQAKKERKRRANERFKDK